MDWFSFSMMIGGDSIRGDGEMRLRSSVQQTASSVEPAIQNNVSNRRLFEHG